MANYDPNDPNKTTPRETYVEPVEKRSSPLPLIIGILAAVVLAAGVAGYAATRARAKAE